MEERMDKSDFVAGVMGVWLLACSSWGQEIQAGPPFKSTPCNMNCRDKGNVVASPPVADPAADQGKHRIFVLTDVGADNDILGQHGFRRNDRRRVDVTRVRV